MSVAVLIPWRDGCEYRARALEWARDQYAKKHPTWSVIIGKAPGPCWVKAAAVTAALRETSAEVLVIADADVWCDRVGVAVDVVGQGHHWALPHRDVHRLGPVTTDSLLAGGTIRPVLVEPAYHGMPGGGLVVLRRELYDQVPLDPRFVGWGGEDEAWGYALTTMAGQPWRGAAPLTHLWHPPQSRASRRVGSTANENLRQRYHGATGSPQAMRLVLDEITKGGDA